MCNNNSHADDDDYFAQGREAHDAGKSDDTCPYPDDSGAGRSWNDGWTTARNDTLD